MMDLVVTDPQIHCCFEISEKHEVSSEKQQKALKIKQ